MSYISIMYNIQYIIYYFLKLCYFMKSIYNCYLLYNCNDIYICNLFIYRYPAMRRGLCILFYLQLPLVAPLITDPYNFDPTDNVSG